MTTTKVHYRSKYASFRVGALGRKDEPVRALQFDNHMAQCDDAELIQHVERSPHFGAGKDFWRDDPVLASLPAPPKEPTATEAAGEGSPAGGGAEPKPAGDPPEKAEAEKTAAPAKGGGKK